MKTDKGLVYRRPVAVRGSVTSLLLFWLITYFNLGDYEMLAGNLASIGVGGLIAVITSYIVSFFHSICSMKISLIMANYVYPLVARRF